MWVCERGEGVYTGAVLATYSSLLLELLGMRKVSGGRGRGGEGGRRTGAVGWWVEWLEWVCERGKGCT